VDHWATWGSLVLSVVVGSGLGIIVTLLLARRWVVGPFLAGSRQAEAKRSQEQRDGFQKDVMEEIRRSLEKLAQAQRVPPSREPQPSPSVLQDSAFRETRRAPSATDVNASVTLLIEEWRSVSGQLDKIMSMVKRLDDNRARPSVIERLSVDRAKLEAAERLRAVIHACPVAIALCRASDGRLLHVNADFGRLLERPAEPLEGLLLPELFSETADRDRLGHALLQQLPVRDFDLTLRTPNREDRVLSITLHPLKLDGEATALVALSSAAERRRAEAQLTEGLSLLTATLESTADGILVVDGTGKVVTYNQKLLQMWRIPESMLRGVGEQDVWMHLMDQVTDPDAFLRMVRKTKRELDAETSDVLACRDGRMFERYSVAQRVGSKVIGRVWSFRDLTEQSWAEQALQESEAQLLQSQKMDAVGRLAGGVAHDLNNLLTVIMGYTQFLLGSLKSDSSAYHDAGEIREAAKRAEALIQQLLTFSRKQPHQPKRVDLNELVTGLSRMLQRLLGVEIRLVTALSTVPSPVYVDQNQIAQVIVNLVVNARDAMPHGGMVTIETANVEVTEAARKTHAGVPSGPYVVLTVIDTGMGMSPETLAHCFEPFFTTKPVGQGTGLGLSTVYGIVKQSDGVIAIQSEQGHGTTVTMHFPRLEADESIDLGPPSVQTMPSGTETILLVEDEEKVRHLLRKVLEQQGYTVLAADSGPSAIQLLTERQIDLLVTDIVMPQMSGLEVASTLRGQQRGLKVLFISGYSGDASMYREIPDGPPLVLQKPFTPAEFAQKIREVLDSPAQNE
jgi:PAS domain S-box-containing protein